MSRGWTYAVWGEQKVINDEHNEMVLKVKAPFNDSYLNMDIRFRAFNDGVAFRYEIPEQEGIEDFSVLDEWAQQALAGTLSAQEALNGAAKAWQGITEDAGLETQKKMYRDLYGI